MLNIQLLLLLLLLKARYVASTEAGTLAHASGQEAILLLDWKLKDFKSFRGMNTLALSPITILCGANSSGKSSLIQSILLIKQTLNHSAGNRTVALNGPLVRLGTFSDIENSQSRKSSRKHFISLGWTISARGASQPTFYGTSEIENISVSFDFDTHGPKAEREVLEIQPTLAKCGLSARYTTEDEAHQLEIALVRPSVQGKGTSEPEAAGKIFAVKTLDPESSSSIVEGYPKGKIVGASVQNFLPYQFIIRYDKGRQDAQRVGRYLYNPPQSRRMGAIEIPRSVAAVLAELWRTFRNSELPLLGPEHNPFSAEEGVTLGHYFNFYSRQTLSVRRHFPKFLFENKGTIDKALVAGFPENYVTAQTRHELLSRCATLNEVVFRFGLQYVGPLRDDRYMPCRRFRRQQT